MFIPILIKLPIVPIDPPIELKQVWAKENKQALFLYIHIPFCEMRCGFCNLFTTVKNNQELFEQYVQAVNRQALQVKAALGPLIFSRFALGGGTPTQLSVSQLEAVLNIAEKTMGARLLEIPGSVEVSPETVNREKLKLLRDRGITRVSIGIQSFIDAEVLAVQRRQNSSQVKAALTLMAEANFPIINIDLIYGLPGQTVESWVRSLREALQFQPQELYLYPFICTSPDWTGQNSARMGRYSISLLSRRAIAFTFRRVHPSLFADVP
jgi:oxygen-independent coproporphyrinogen-3 oxidase